MAAIYAIPPREGRAAKLPFAPLLIELPLPPHGRGWQAASSGEPGEGASITARSAPNPITARQEARVLARREERSRPQQAIAGAWSAGRAEAAPPAHRGGKFLGRNDLGVGYRGNDELREPLATADHERLIAMIDDDHHQFAAVVGIDGARAVEEREPVPQGKSRRGGPLRLVAARQFKREARRNERAGAGRNGDRGPFGHARHDIEACGLLRLIGRKRKPLAVREPLHANRNAHSAAGRLAASVAAARARRRIAVSSLLRGGQSSTPEAVIRWICVPSPPITPVPGATSLATIQSAPLTRSFSLAFAIRFSVSAAKPMTRRGRSGPGFASVPRISGFSLRRSEVSRPSFFSFRVVAPAARQSATAAAQMAMSAGRLASAAASISSAVSTLTTRTPSGSGSDTGPVRSVTSAPSETAARAKAWPCLPEERLTI